MSKSNSVIRLKPYQYIHILDNNTNVTTVRVGPATLVREEHQSIVSGPSDMITIPPRNYCIINNPVIRDAKKEIVTGNRGEIRTKIGDKEIRFQQPPFPLFPGESVMGKVQPLQIVGPNEAIKLKALRDFKSEDGKERQAGEEWMFQGPSTYIPRIEVKVLELIKATIVLPNTALLIKAIRKCNDGFGDPREAGEEYLMRKEGAFLPTVDEKIVSTVKAVVLTEKKALRAKAKRTFVDMFKKKRQAGDEWLITIKDAEIYIPDVNEEVIGEVRITTLNPRQYCVILNPINEETKKPDLGHRVLRVGELSFFLRPGEKIEGGIKNIWVLGCEEALLLKCKEPFDDKEFTKQRKPGELWMIKGPRDYVPPVEIEVVEKRKEIPLDENEGIYVRNIRTGKVRVVKGESYMLNEDEELWEKPLPDVVKDLIEKEYDPYGDRGAFANKEKKKSKKRDYTRLVTIKAPHNSTVQIYDYKKKESRVVFGPDLVMIYPDESFTLLSISGGKPKRPDVIKSLALLLGPDFMTDIVQVETADHARLSLQLSYNWRFLRVKGEEHKLFAVPDFVGDACKAIASRVRGQVAQVKFDDFHKNSAKIIRTAVFGQDQENKVQNSLLFTANNLEISNVDIQSVEPIDQRTRDSLNKSVQMAIEITTMSQEAQARHNAMRVEQEARGKLERQKIKDQATAEKNRKRLLELKAESAAVESMGQAIAEAKAKAEATQIEADAAVDLAVAKAKVLENTSNAEIDQLKQKQEAQLDYEKKLNELEINKAKRSAEIEAKKFKEVVDAIGPGTITNIAQAGPEMQAKLLSGLGLQTMLLTDGKSPINLFSTANGLIKQSSKKE